MAYKISNGSEEIQFDVPASWDVINVATPNVIKAIPASEIPERVKEALRKPVAGHAILDLVKPGATVAIAVDDISRHTPAKLLVEPLIDLLYELGVSKDRITIIFALGMHREMCADDAKTKLGTRIAAEIRWENHQLDKNLVDLGKSAAGTPIFINKTFHDANVRIAIGLIEPHLWAGFSGGAKCVCPGLAGGITIAAHHKQVMDKRTRVGPELSDNPFRTDIEDIVQRAGLNMILNCVLNLDSQVCHIVAGSPKTAYEKGVELARPISEVRVSDIADVIISASNPLGIDFRQSSKAAFNTQGALKDGGVLIVVSPCKEGIGNLRASENPPTIKKIRTLFNLHLQGAVWKSILKSGYGIEDAAGVYQMFKFISKKNFVMCTKNLADDRSRKLLWMCSHTTTIDEAMQLAEKLLDKGKRSARVKCIIFPLGGVTYPVLSR